MLLYVVSIYRREDKEKIEKKKENRKNIMINEEQTEQREQKSLLVLPSRVV
jgi:hypothetical protein